jgi:hypothetical protein
MILVNYADLRCPTGRAIIEEVEELDIGLIVVRPLVGQIVFVVDGFNRADWLTSTAIDALIRLDVEHTIALIDAIDRTFVDTCAILEINTGLGDNIRHEISAPFTGENSSTLSRLATES